MADPLRADCTRALRADHIDTFAARRLYALLLREAGAEDRALDELTATYGITSASTAPIISPP